MGLHAVGRLPDLDAAAALVGVHDAEEPDVAHAALYRQLRPLVEQSALALSGVFTELAELSPPPAEAR
jgi:gluconokinase